MTLIEQDQVFEATIGSGLVYSIENWLDECCRLINKDWKCYVIAKRNFTAAYRVLISNPATINSIGWAATTKIDELAKIMVQHQDIGTP